MCAAGGLSSAIGASTSLPPSPVVSSTKQVNPLPVQQIRKIPDLITAGDFCVFAYAGNMVRDLAPLFFPFFREFFFDLRSVGKAKHNALLEMVGI